MTNSQITTGTQSDAALGPAHVQGTGTIQGTVRVAKMTLPKTHISSFLGVGIYARVYVAEK